MLPLFVVASSLTEVSAESLTAYASVFVALTAVGALAYTNIQIQTSRGMAQIEHLLEFENQFRSEPLVSARVAVGRDRINGIDVPEDSYVLLDFLEMMGMLLRRGYLEREDLWDAFGSWVLLFMSWAQPIVKTEQISDQNMYRNVSFLHQQMLKVEREKNGPGGNPKAAELVEFWKSEATTKTGIPIPQGYKGLTE